MQSSFDHDYHHDTSDGDHIVIRGQDCGQKRKRSLNPNDFSREVYENWSLKNEMDMVRDVAPAAAGGKQSIYDRKWKCDYCDYTIRHKKARMLAHLEEKHGYDRKKDTFDPYAVVVPPDRKIIEIKQVAFVDLVNQEAHSEQRGRIRIIRRNPEKVLSETKIDKYVQNLNENQIALAQKYLAEFMFEKALPFTVFESDAWKKFIDQAAPSMRMPSAYQFSTTLLEQSYQESMTKSLDVIQDSPAVTIGIDECKLAGKPHMINILACIPEPYFIASHDSKGSSITTDYLEMILTKTLSSPKLSGIVDKIRAIVTDNGSNIKALRNRLESRNGIQIILGDGTTKTIRAAGIYCLCHGVSLMIQDFSRDSWIKSRIDLAMEIAKKINQNNQLRQLLAAYTQIDHLTLTRFHLPPHVRWLYLQKFLQSFIPFENPIKSMFKCKMDQARAMLGSEWKRDLRPLVSDEWWKDLKCINAAVLPLVEAITSAESTKSTIADGFMSMIRLKENKHKFITLMAGRQMDADSWIYKFEERYRAVISNYHRLAAFFHPRHRFDSRVEIYFLEAEGYLVSAAVLFGFSEDQISVMTTELFYYIEKKEPFKKAAFDLYRDDWGPAGWWKRCAPDKELTKLALILLSIPSSNASVERSFSHQGLIFSQRRQSLGAERLNKLTKIKFDAAKKIRTRKTGPDNDDEAIWKELDLEEVCEEYPPLDLYEDHQLEDSNDSADHE